MAALLAAWSAPAQTLSLHQAVAEALRSPEALAAQAQTEEASGQLRQAGLRPNPRLFVQSEDWRPWDSNFSFADETEDYGYLSQTFELGGKRTRRMDFARDRVAEARANEARTRAAISLRVATAYWNVVVAARLAELLAADLGAMDGMVRYNQERVDAGAMRGVDLLRMQMERDRLRLSLAAARRDAGQAQLELWRQMGQPARMDAELSDTLDALVPVPSVPMEAVLAARPEIEQARDAVEAAKADQRLQKAAAVPDLDLLGGYKRNSGVNTGYGGLQIPLPLFNRNQGEIERAGAAVSYAQHTLDGVVLQVRAEVQENERSYAEQTAMVRDVLPDMRSKAKEDLRLMTEAYRVGGVDLLRLLDAERAELDTEATALRTMGELQQAAVRLRISYGQQL